MAATDDARRILPGRGCVGADGHDRRTGLAVNATTSPQVRTTNRIIRASGPLML